MRASNFASRPSNILRDIGRFNRDEGGALLIFGLILFTLMAIMGGVALDLMRYETTRVTLQNTLDRSTLAAASLTNDLDPESVVRDYVAKAGLSEQLAGVTVSEAMNDRKVAAVGVADARPFFMHMIGINEFMVNVRAAAQQSITNVEIVLVLDVSGSMTGQKIADLKVSAMEFVNSMLENDPEHRVSISIVPYNAQVNIGPNLRDAYTNITNRHGVANANCVELPAAAFSTSAMPTDITMPMMAYADIANGTYTVNAAVSPTSSYALPNYGSAFCKPSTVNIIRLPSNDATTLTSQINALQAGGNTSIMLGMKWGLTMIDPATRSIYADFITGGQMSSLMVARPYDYEDLDAMKVVVLMTDGEHVAHDRINDAYKTGPSPIWRSSIDGQYSVYHASRAGLNKYYVPHLNLWQPLPWGLVASQQNWETIWANLKMSYVAWQFYGRALGTSDATRTTVYNTTVTAMRSVFASVSTMNGMLQQSCTLAKEAGVIVYGIAFEAPSNGQAQISTCASSVDAHYFNATDGDEMRTAFRTIASNLSQLKLTQ